MRNGIALAATAVAACCAVVALSAAPAGSQAGTVRQAERLARETLPPGDGWASDTTGTTGGAAATPDSVFVVTTRQELRDALSKKVPARIIIVSGTIRANGDTDNQPLPCSAFADPAYSLDAFAAAYDPATWGKKTPSGPLEAARSKSADAQKKYIRLDVPANTTIVGLGRDARIVGGHVKIVGVDNVIVRNLTIEDAYDCFPAWDPKDGSAGNWNSNYDLISVDTSTHVWIDHCAFNDGDHPDSLQPSVFGRLYQQHDGAIDITKAADLVTLSWNQFTNHDKLIVIGSSDSYTGDRGKERVTLHHNLFQGIVQRMPRVRFGQVHVYNNYYDVDEHFSYAWGVGVESQIFAENNFFNVTGDTSPGELIERYGGTAIYAGETLFNGPAVKDHVDPVAEYNAVNDTDLGYTVGWAPVLFQRIDPTSAVPALVKAKAGPFNVNGK